MPRQSRIAPSLVRASGTHEARSCQALCTARWWAIPAGVALAATAVACGRDTLTDANATLGAARPLAEVAYLDVSRCSPAAGGFTTTFSHPYFFPGTVGFQSTLEGGENGEDVKVTITVLNQTRNIGGVVTRVIEEREWTDGELAEVSWNYYAQAGDGSICYFGEDVDIFGDGGISHGGAWCTGGANAAGIFLPAELQPGTRFQMEVAPGIAMDEGLIVGTGPASVPLGRYTTTLRVREFNPLDGDKGFKTFAEGVGLIVDGPAKLTAIAMNSGVPALPTISTLSCGT